MVNKYEITINGKTYSVEVANIAASSAEVVVNGERKVVEFREVASAPVAPAEVSAAAPAAPPEPKPVEVSAPAPAAVPAPKAEPTAVAPVSGQGKIVAAPMPGKVLSIKVKAGDKVSSGDIVCTLEAMKMEMPISSTVDGKVVGVHVQVGDTVAYDAPLLTIG